MHQPERLPSSRVPSSPVSLLALALASGLLSAPATAQGTTNLKIAVVDIDRVVILSNQGQALQKRLKDLETEMQARLQEKVQRLESLQQSLTGKGLEETRAIQKQIEDENLAGRRIREDAERLAQKMRDDELERIRASLQPVFEKIQQESAYDLILNLNPALVITASRAVDITDRVIEILNQGG